MVEWIDEVAHISADELHAIVNDPTKTDVVVIDVREPDEYTAGHIPGVPLIPKGQFPNIVDQLDPNAEYVFICRSGRRSFDVAKFLQGHGFSHVHNYKGGMLVWDKDMVAGPEHVIENLTSMDQLKRL